MVERAFGRVLVGGDIRFAVVVEERTAIGPTAGVILVEFVGGNFGSYIFGFVGIGV